MVCIKSYTEVELAKLGFRDMGATFADLHAFSKGGENYLFKEEKDGLSFYLRYNGTGKVTDVFYHMPGNPSEQLGGQA